MGAITAACTPCRQATIAAIQATIVLPLPTSPCRSRCIGCGFPRSFRISLTTRRWAPVSSNGSRRLISSTISRSHGKRNRLLPLRSRPPKGERPLKGEKLAEDQAPLLGRGEFPEPLRVGVVARKVDGGERLLEGRDPDPRENGGGETFDLQRSVPPDHLPLDLAEDPRRNPFHLRVDGDDPAGMDRVGRVFLREDLRVVHFGEEAEPPRGSAERHRLPDAEPFGQGGVEAEPFRGEAPGTVGDHDLQDPGRAEPFSSALHGKDLPADGYGHPRLQFPDGNDLAPVFVIPREEVEGVVRCPDPPGGKLFPQAGPHPLDVLDGVRCGHRAPVGGFSESSTCSAGSSRGTPGDSGRTGRPRSGPRSRGRRRARRPGW